MNALCEKWNRVYSPLAPGGQSPASVLGDNEFLLGQNGKALDLACGLGANAVFLALRGFDVTALDISSVAIEKLRAYAEAQQLAIDARVADITPACLPPGAFDVIVVSRFLDRSLADALMTALKPDGLLFYQTFTRLKVNAQGPNNPNYLLAEAELPELFAPLGTVYYRDNAALGDLRRGLRNEAQFIGRKIGREPCHD